MNFVRSLIRLTEACLLSLSIRRLQSVICLQLPLSAPSVPAHLIYQTHCPLYLHILLHTQDAADMNERVINEFCKIIDPTDRSLLVVFIDTPASIRHLLIDYPQLAQVVTAQFVRETYSVTELLEYARGYADREDSVFDKSGELAQMERLKVIAGNQERNKKRIVEMIVNNAIEKAEKKSMRKLFQSKYDKRGCLILRDKDFEVG